MYLYYTLKNQEMIERLAKHSPKLLLCGIYHNSKREQPIEADNLLRRQMTPHQQATSTLIQEVLLENLPSYIEALREKNHFNAEKTFYITCYSTQSLYATFPALIATAGFNREKLTGTVAEWIYYNIEKNAQLKIEKTLNLPRSFERNDALALASSLDCAGAIELKELNTVIFSPKNGPCFYLTYGSPCSAGIFDDMVFDLEEGFISEKDAQPILGKTPLETILVSKINEYFYMWVARDYEGDLFPSDLAICETPASAATSAFIEDAKPTAAAAAADSDGNNETLLSLILNTPVRTAERHLEMLSRTEEGKNGYAIAAETFRYTKETDDKLDIINMFNVLLQKCLFYPVNLSQLYKGLFQATSEEAGLKTSNLHLIASILKYKNEPNINLKMVTFLKILIINASTENLLEICKALSQKSLLSSHSNILHLITNLLVTNSDEDEDHDPLFVLIFIEVIQLLQSIVKKSSAESLAVFCKSLSEQTFKNQEYPYNTTGWCNILQSIKNTVNKKEYFLFSGITKLLKEIFIRNNQARIYFLESYVIFFNENKCEQKRKAFLYFQHLVDILDITIPDKIKKLLSPYLKDYLRVLAKEKTAEELETLCDPRSPLGKLIDQKIEISRGFFSFFEPKITETTERKLAAELLTGKMCPASATVFARPANA